MTAIKSCRRGGLNRSVTTSNLVVPYAADGQPTAPVRSVSLAQSAGMPIGYMLPDYLKSSDLSIVLNTS